VSSRLDPNATIIWGATIDENLENTVRVLLVITGVQSRIEFTDTGLRRKKTELLNIPKI